MALTPAFDSFVDALKRLPGIGPKSAQRIALQLLLRDREAALALSHSAKIALEQVGQCQSCRMLAEGDLCRYCNSNGRDDSLVCVVEGPADVLAIEQGGSYNGLYFLLMGHLAPIDGIGPEELGIDLLIERLDGGRIRELIIATSSTVEGDATAQFIASLASQRQITVTRIAQGVPLGGELEYVDSGTLSRAISSRQAMES